MPGSEFKYLGSVISEGGGGSYIHNRTQQGNRDLHTKLSIQVKQDQTKNINRSDNISD